MSAAAAKTAASNRVLGRATSAAACASVAVLWSLAGALARTPDDAVVDYELHLSQSDDATVGESRALSLTIAPRPGFTISRAGPLSLDLATQDAEPPVVELAAKRYQRRDAADAQAEAPRFDLRYRAVAAGDARLLVTASFWVCGRRACRPVRADRAVDIRVRAAEPTP